MVLSGTDGSHSDFRGHVAMSGDILGFNFRFEISGASQVKSVTGPQTQPARRDPRKAEHARLGGGRFNKQGLFGQRHYPILKVNTEGLPRFRQYEGHSAPSRLPAALTNRRFVFGCEDRLGAEVHSQDRGGPRDLHPHWSTSG